MTPAEQNLIEDIFNRIRSHGAAGRDGEADTLIGHLMRETPGAAYALVQSVLVQDQALREADQRIRTLEQRQVERGADGSFLGSADRQHWNASPTGPSTSAPQGDATPLPSAERGRFLRGALQTAAGIAGGALLFEGVRSLLHGGSGGVGDLAGDPWGNPGTVVNDTTINETVLGDDRFDRSGQQSADDDDPDWTDDSDGSSDPNGL
ncbi:DUF2076 domain-containing protein (plasmid) [Mesorhizobium sp. ISC25]|uniref:DUF2076 domain-containing protein n=1 Tax=Mesorhizobium sp. ISC25 TaxID=3077335 RepID=UPI0035D831AF